jgi:hypothetical protein
MHIVSSKQASKKGQDQRAREKGEGGVQGVDLKKGIHMDIYLEDPANVLHIVNMLVDI